jgi:aminomethyltransferase
MCNERGGVIDDLYAYRFSTSEFLIIVNAGRVETDFAWLQRLLGKFDRRHLVSLTNVSDNTAAIAVQGPAVVQFIDECFSGGSTGGAVVARASDLKKNQIAQFLFNHNPAWVSRTGYTGEDGFEIVSTPETIVAAWDKLMAVGGPHGLRPAGLGARDTLRTEVCYPLYGQDLDEQSSPMEAGLSAFVAFNKGEFVGRTVLLEQKEHGIVRKCVAFKMTDKSAPPRPHYTIWAAPNGAFIGEVSSGTQSPTLGIGIGMGYLKAEFAKPQTHLEIEIRGRRHPAIVTPRPLYRKPV